MTANAIHKTLFAGLSLALVFSSCSNLKTVSSVNNYDDAYFSETDLNKRGTYYSKNKDADHDQAELRRESGTTSYGQTYADRLRNFGDGTMQQPVRQVPGGFGMGFMGPNQFGVMGGFNPYAGFNPYCNRNPYMGWNNFNQFGFNSGFGWNDPFYGYNPYAYMYQDP